MVHSSPDPSGSKRRALTPIFTLAERAMTHPATITDLRALAPEFVQVTLQADQFRNAPWQPGDKIDAEVAPLSYRAYTPCCIDRRSGLLKIVVFDHGKCAGSRRLSISRAGEIIRVRGPKSSTPMLAADGNLSLFGDETSIGLLAARQSQCPDFRGDGSVIETSVPGALGQALTKLALDRATVVPHAGDNAHLPGVARQIFEFLGKEPGRKVILTGQANSIQIIRKHLLSQGACKSRIASHAFWAKGKIALG